MSGGATLLGLELLLLAVGLLLVGIGLRGRRVSNDAFCRSCGFNLRGRWPEIERCPECGAGVDTRSGVRIGLRRRRWIPVAAGAVLCLTALLQVGMLLAPQDLDRYKPVWWLRFEARHGTAAASADAIDELLRRINDGSLAVDAIAPISDALLRRQADGSQEWDPIFGDAIEIARAGGAVDDAQWQNYFVQGLTPEFTVRQHVREGEGVPLSADIREVRLGSGTYRYGFHLDDFRSGAASVTGRCPEAIVTVGTGSSGSTGVRMIMSVDLGPRVAVLHGLRSARIGMGRSIDLPIGRHELTATVKQRVMPAGGQWQDFATPFEGTVEVLADDQDLVEPDGEGAVAPGENR